MSLPYISIITPTFNAEDLIERTLVSVSNQQFKQYEHLIIDSESTDSTLKIVKKYSKKNPIHWISEKDNGISEAFNKGIKNANGKWILFLGAGDELYNSNILTEMETELKKREGDLLVWGNIVFKNKDGIIGKGIKGFFPKKRLKQYMCLTHQSTFHNNRLFSEYELYDTSLKSAMDYELLIRNYDKLALNGYVDKTISYMLIGGISQQSNGSLKEFRFIQKKYRVWKIIFIPDFLYWYALIKNALKRILHVNKV